MKDRAQFAGIDHPLQRHDRGQPAPVVAGRDHDAGSLRRLQSAGRAVTREREWLLDEDRLAGPRARHHLVGVARVRRREDDPVYRRIGQRGVEARERPDAQRVAIGGGRGRIARHGGGEANRVAPALHGVDENLAPASESDDGE